MATDDRSSSDPDGRADDQDEFETERDFEFTEPQRFLNVSPIYSGVTRFRAEKNTNAYIISDTVVEASP